MTVGIIGGGIHGLFVFWRLGHKVQVYGAGRELQQTRSASPELLH